jgi:RimJ/RimL family protein N-acetyltransferase
MRGLNSGRVFPCLDPVELHSSLVNLRAVLQTDDDRLFDSYFQSLEVARFLSRAPHSSVSQTRAVLQKWCEWGTRVNKSNFGWVIADAKSDFPVGVLYVMHDGVAAQVHYGIGMPFWNQGYATEAVTLATNWLLAQDAVEIVWTAVDYENMKTRRVLEKAGFEQVGLLVNWAILPAITAEAARDALRYQRLRIE